MLAELRDAFILTSMLGPALCLVGFAPLWAPEFLFPAPKSKPPSLNRMLHIGDAAGLVPAVVVIVGISTLQSASTTSTTHRLVALAAAVLLSVVLWVRSVQFANSFCLKSNSKRAVVVGVIYPVTILSASYTALAVIVIVSCIIRFEVPAIPYIAVAAGFLATSLPVCLFLRRQCHDLLARDGVTTLGHDSSTSGTAVN